MRIISFVTYSSLGNALERTVLLGIQKLCRVLHVDLLRYAISVHNCPAGEGTARDAYWDTERQTDRQTNWGIQTGT